MTRRAILLFLLIFRGVSSLNGAASNTGSEAVVVFNTAVPESREIAEHYAERRDVPPSQVFGFELPTSETISRQDFEEKLQRPLWNILKERRLFTLGEKSELAGRNTSVVDAKIRYAVLCLGVPVKILPDPSRQEAVPENVPVALQRNEASVDSELAALPMLEMNPLITSVLPNPGYGATNVSALHPTNGVLIVGRLDGPTPEIAKGLVDKAIRAEEHGLWGRAYFDTRGLTNGPYMLGDRWIRESAEAAEQFGFDVVVDKAAGSFPGATPMPDIAIYMGWYDQHVSGPFTNNMAEFAPGAIAYHLHSYSAHGLRTANQWWAGPLLAKGATFTMGCTEEPYLQMTPDVNMFLRRVMFVGWSAGEAAYSSQQVLSWQVTVVGDPLYSPFRISQKERYAKLEAEKSKDIEWSMMMWVNLRLAAGASLDEIEAYYSANPQTKESAILQERLGNIYKSRGKLSSAVPRLAAAAQLASTPLQRLRITLSAATLLSTWGRAQESYDLYKQVLEDFPDYPGKKDIYERLAKVAQRLRKNEEAAEYQRLAQQS